ncbi:RES family NAD+ phosphorylase [Stenotrophomonas sp. HITSZ_GD]|uniref:RES family NAD+ phosphorylase n=1 Tax=Stenotrophomonas sp. HITSZ_GD TaxID=3037248 RepID=UPI00240D8383|nr:RES family NAD+ phosphorylase [Stenotrophomonas sp. HITSZ_GD]MDG2524203.1 RES family NAD+ phosphorylase [Stenotrophomonas sp. HITSZ_GD]
MNEDRERRQNQRGKKMICSGCVTSQTLKGLVERSGEAGACSYCGNAGTTVESNTLFDYIYSRVKENVASEDDLSSYEHAMLYEGGSDEIEVNTYDIVLMEWFNLGEEVYFDDLLAQAPADFKIDSRGNETHFFNDNGLLERNVYEDRWGNFIDDIRHVHRFFNPNARAFLDSVFKLLISETQELKPEVIRTLDRGTELYRARGVESYQKAKEIADDPASQLGPAPKGRASSQRMTPSGISALYCALERETCLSEIRSITGDDVVSVAFTPTADMKLLDLTKLELVEPPRLTLLDVGYLDAQHLMTFLKSLVKKMSKPKGRNDELSYLSTQVVFEYLRLRFVAEVDGLVFPSVQTGEQGTNVVLFPEASVLSANRSMTPSASEAALGSEANESLAPDAKLAVVEGSLRFHKVKAIKTEADTYGSLYDLYMSDETRRRLGLPAAPRQNRRSY